MPHDGAGLRLATRRVLFRLANSATGRLAASTTAWWSTAYSSRLRDGIAAKEQQPFWIGF
jgi:hypothetical protein